MDRDWPRPLVHFEIEEKDIETMKRFYSAMFNWGIGDPPIASFDSGVGGPEPGPAGHHTSDRATAAASPSISRSAISLNRAHARQSWAVRSCSSAWTYRTDPRWPRSRIRKATR